MMLHRLIIAFAALLMPLSAGAQDLEGTWDFRLAETTIFRFEIAEGEDGSWQGTWHRPENFASDGNRFARLRGGVEEIGSMAGYEFLGNVELSFADPNPGAVPDIFRFEQIGPDLVAMTYVGTGLEPYQLVRAEDPEPIGAWDENAVYRRPLPENAGDGDIRVRTPPDDGASSPFRILRRSDRAAPVENEPDSADEARIEPDFLEGF